MGAKNERRERIAACVRNGPCGHPDNRDCWGRNIAADSRSSTVNNPGYSIDSSNKTGTYGAALRSEGPGLPP